MACFQSFFPLEINIRSLNSIKDNFDKEKTQLNNIVAPVTIPRIRIQHQKEEEWKLVIKPQNNLLNLQLKVNWRYRNLLQMFVRKDFGATFKQGI